MLTAINTTSLYLIDLTFSMLHLDYMSVSSAIYTSLESTIFSVWDITHDAV